MMNYKNFGKYVYFQFINKKINLNIIIHETDSSYFTSHEEVNRVLYDCYLKENFIEL